LREQHEKDPEVAALVDGQRYLQDADMMHDAVHSDVLMALMEGVDFTVAANEVASRFAEDSTQFRDDLNKLDQFPLNNEAKALAANLRPPIDDYLGQAQAIVSLAPANKHNARTHLPGFNQAFNGLVIAI
jgi:hypothetical protein